MRNENKPEIDVKKTTTLHLNKGNSSISWVDTSAENIIITVSNGSLYTKIEEFYNVKQLVDELMGIIKEDKIC